MPKIVLTDVSVSINGSTALSNSIAQVELSVESDSVETTSFGSTWRSRQGGLQSGSITLSFMQDYAAGAVDAVLWPLFNTIATVAVRPTSSTVSATNPSYSGTFLVSQYSPVSGSVGDLATLDVTWDSAGPITRATA